MVGDYVFAAWFYSSLRLVARVNAHTNYPTIHPNKREIRVWIAYAKKKKKTTKYSYTTCERKEWKIKKKEREIENNMFCFSHFSDVTWRLLHVVVVFFLLNSDVITIFAAGSTFHFPFLFFWMISFLWIYNSLFSKNFFFLRAFVSFYPCVCMLWGLELSSVSSLRLNPKKKKKKEKVYQEWKSVSGVRFTFSLHNAYEIYVCISICMIVCMLCVLCVVFCIWFVAGLILTQANQRTWNENLIQILSHSHILASVLYVLVPCDIANCNKIFLFFTVLSSFCFFFLLFLYLLLILRLLVFLLLFGIFGLYPHK